MPLVVPGVASTKSGGDARIEEWTNKLVGKKLSDEAATETVRPPSPPSPQSHNCCSTMMHPLCGMRRNRRFQLTWILCPQTFCKKDLPEQCRVIGPNQMVTMDFRPDRLNVHVREDGVVSHVRHG